MGDEAMKLLEQQQEIQSAAIESLTRELRAESAMRTQDIKMLNDVNAKLTLATEALLKTKVDLSKAIGGNDSWEDFMSAVEAVEKEIEEALTKIKGQTNE